MNFLTYLLTFIANVVFAILAFVVLILVLNGFSERDANWGVYGYIGLMSLSLAIVPLFAVLGRGMMLRRGYGQNKSTVIAVVGFSVAGFVLTSGIFFISTILVEIVRNVR